MSLQESSAKSLITWKKNSAAMSMSLEEKSSRIKLSKLIAAFNEDVDVKVIEAILETEGNINYAIMPSEQLESLNHTLQPGTILYQIGQLNKNKISKIFKLLIDQGANITWKNNEGQTALHTEILRQSKSNPDLWNRFDHPVVDSILSAHVQHSIRKNPCDHNGITHFHIACMAKHLKAVDFFLNNGANVNQIINKDSPLFPGCTPLHIAVNCCSLDIARKLLDHGANAYSKDAQGLTPVYVLIKRNLEIMNCDKQSFINYEKFLLEYQMNQHLIHLLLTNENINNNNNDAHIITDENGFSSLHAACTINDIGLVEDLLRHVKDTNHTVKSESLFWPGHSALHFAAYFDFNLVDLLIRKGGDVMVKDAHGVTPFDICLQRNNIQDICSILSKHSTWKNIMFSNNKTKLLDLLDAMQNESDYNAFLSQIKDVNLAVDTSSPLWPGYTIMHFAVLFSERSQVDFYGLLCSNENNECVDDMWLIDDCMEHGMDVSILTQDSYGSTPLHLAFNLGKENIVDDFLEYLEKHDQIADSVDKNNISLLSIACCNQHFSVTQKLIQNGADVNIAIRSMVKPVNRDLFTHRVIAIDVTVGSTPLHMLLLNHCFKDVEAAKFLLKHGADLNATNENGWSPVHNVILLEYPDTMGRALLSSAKLRERTVQDIGLSHLHVACRVDSLKGVKKLLKLGSNVNAAITCDPISLNKKYTDHYCADECDLICKNSYAGFTPLHFAVQRGSLKITNVLLEASADILARNAKGMSPLYEVLATNKHNKLFDAFVTFLRSSQHWQRRLKEDSGITLLHIFAFKMDVKAIKKLLDDEIDVNTKTQLDSPIWPGCTALHTWVYGSLEYDYGAEDVKNTLKLLLDSGADVTLSNAMLDTPLHSFNYAHIIIDDEIILSTGRLLLRSQTDFNVNPVNATGVSHFHIATRMCDVVVVETFLKHGVDVNQPVDYFSNDDKHVERPGCTPLHLLMYGQSRYLESLPARMEMIDLLLKYGADVRAQDVFGNTPLHAVAKNEYLREQLLEKIIHAGSVIDDINIFGDTPFAVLMKSMSTIARKEITIFLEQGCHINVYNNIDQTGFLALTLDHIRTKKQFNDIYRILFKSPDVKSVDECGRTVVHNIVSSRVKVPGYYIQEFYIELIERLMKLGCDIDAQDQSGKTALHMAVQFKNNRALAALLRSGADVNINDKDGKSAFDYSFDQCNCSDDEYRHQHKYLVKTISVHVKAMQYLKLDVNERNKNLIGKAQKILSSDLSVTSLCEKEIEQMKKINILELDSIRLYDFLSETGAVAAFATMPHLKRKAIDKYFKMKNKAVDLNFGGLLKLQYKKAVKRRAMIALAKSSLRFLCRGLLPDLCCDNLLRYLSFSDVNNLISSTKML